MSSEKYNPEKHKGYILWVEDRKETITSQIKWIWDKGYFVLVVSSAQRLGDILDEHYQHISLIIMDILLFGVSSLEILGVLDSETDSGIEAGWMIVKDFIKSGNSKYREIPVLFYSYKAYDTTHTSTLNQLKKIPNSWVDFVVKGKTYDSDKITSNDQFKIVFEQWESWSSKNKRENKIG